MYSVPESAPAEDKAISQLVNSGMNPKQLYKAAYTFYRVALEEQLIAKQPVVVQSGLFKGMVLFPGSLGSQLLPKWLGTYEAEVQGLLEEQAKDCNCFIDIGCAEGFYLTGMAPGWVSPATAATLIHVHTQPPLLQRHKIAWLTWCTCTPPQPAQ
uniref:hypothetical protein n=1 Tax=Cyanobium sp. TaxID=2164130 RepID=UPI0040488B91